MRKMRHGLKSDDKNDVHSVTQLKRLVKKALEDRRAEKLAQRGQTKRRQRQASLTAVLEVADGEKFIKALKEKHADGLMRMTSKSSVGSLELEDILSDSED